MLLNLHAQDKRERPDGLCSRYDAPRLTLCLIKGAFSHHSQETLEHTSQDNSKGILVTATVSTNPLDASASHTQTNIRLALATHI